MDVREVTAQNANELGAFFRGLPAGDRTFFWSDVTDPAVAQRWAGDPNRIRRCAVDDGGRIVAFAALVPGSDWSGHVAELVLVVAAGARRAGIGRALARVMLLEAMQAEFKKITVNIAADNEAAIAMFQGIGFDSEALLRDHLRNPDDGRLRDLVVLAHLVDERYATMQAAGLGEIAR
jgi:ribosomal protein S18 acetylase RimI-like enzyme